MCFTLLGVEGKEMSGFCVCYVCVCVCVCVCDSANNRWLGLNL